MDDLPRYYKQIEKQIDIFIEICRQHIAQRGLEKQIWVTKDQQESLVSIGDPDKHFVNKNYGFVFYYEMILSRELSLVIDEFVFKLNHFIKTASLTDKFPAFKPPNDKKT